MEIKVREKCIVCECPLSFSVREKSLTIPGGLKFWIGKIPVKECKKCLEVYEDEITIKDYKIKILNQILDRSRRDNSFQILGNTCFWIRQSIYLSREELVEFTDEKVIKQLEHSNEALSPYLVNKLEFFIQKFLSKEMALKQ